MALAAMPLAGCSTLGRLQGDWSVRETSMAPARPASGAGSASQNERAQNWQLIERIALYQGGTCWGVFAGSGGKDTFTGTWSVNGDKIAVSAGAAKFTASFRISESGELVLTTPRAVGESVFDVTLVLTREAR
jgi:hypothetical protein